MSEGKRFEDRGLARIIKEYWAVICLVFALGGIYQQARTNNALSDKLQTRTDDHEHRITQVEEAVKYLAQVVRDDRRRRLGE